MFSTSKQVIFSVSIVVAFTLVSESSHGQSDARRVNTLRQAQSRGQAYDSSSDPRFDSRTVNRVARRQGSGSRLESAPQGSGVRSPSRAPIVGGPSSPRGYQAPHLGSDVVSPAISDSAIVDGGSPVVGESYIESYDDGYFDNGWAESGQAVGRCTTCGDRSGGCGHGYWENCWIRGLTGYVSNAEFFAGAQGFRSQNFIAGTQPVDDSSFGFYGGVNLGLPLCGATCGLLSGQIGIRSVQSEFDGDTFSADNRDQLYVTAGVFRRVDYGIQAGIVGDFLHEEWFAETDLAQIRGDISWVYPGGNAIGFRFATGTEDDVTNGIINGAAFGNLFAEVIDTYRFYYRFTAAHAGYCDAYVGFSDGGNADHAVFGLDYDMPLRGPWALQSGFTYLLPDVPTGVAASTQDAWNVYVGLSFRPQGTSWYGNYDRPLFNVADNGSFIIGRN